jgi:DNA transposition AAA+ family ATPase
MEVSLERKERILQKIKTKRANFSGSDAKFAVTLGISAAQFSRINSGELERVISDANWLSIARKLGVNLSESYKETIVKTPAFQYIYAQLEFCQRESKSGLLCDLPDIGKTVTARYYVSNNKNAVYIDCSQVKSKFALVRAIAQEFGINTTGRYKDIYADLTYYLRSLQNSLIILDESGDLEYSAFLELKALWNATEGCCGWYQMGADGLKKKMQLGIEYKRVGFAENFSRFGSRYQKITPDTDKELLEFKVAQGAMYIKANAADTNIDIMKTIAASDYSLRRIAIEVRKYNKNLKS